MIGDEPKDVDRVRIFCNFGESAVGVDDVERVDKLEFASCKESGSALRKSDAALSVTSTKLQYKKVSQGGEK